MAEKKAKKVKKTKKAKSTKAKSKAKTKSTSARSKKNELFSDSGIIIVDDDFSTDKEREIEERRAYLEEARSQEASD